MQLPARPHLATGHGQVYVTHKFPPPRGLWRSSRPEGHVTRTPKCSPPCAAANGSGEPVSSIRNTLQPDELLQLLRTRRSGTITRHNGWSAPTASRKCPEAGLTLVDAMQTQQSS